MGVRKVKKRKVSYKSWYILACEAGRENWVLDFLSKERKLRNLEKEIGHIVIPHHIVDKHHPNKGWYEEREKLFPGYMLIQMNFNRETMLLIEDAKRRDAFGLLPLRPTFLVKHPDPRKRPTKKLDLRKQELEMLEEWVPHKCSTQEAALIMLKTNQTETPPPTTNITVGVQIIVTNPKSSFVNQQGKVQQVIKQEKGFQFVVEIKIADRPVVIRVSHKDCEATSN